MISITPISTRKSLSVPSLQGIQAADSVQDTAATRTAGTRNNVASQAKAAAEGFRRADEARLLAKIQSDSILKSAASSLSVPTSDIIRVDVSASGSVCVEGSLEREVAAKLEASLQGNTEFVRAYKNASAVVDTAASLVDEGIEEYA